MEKKIARKYADLIAQANNSTGRKEAISLIKQATKLKTRVNPFQFVDSEVLPLIPYLLLVMTR